MSANSPRHRSSRQIPSNLDAELNNFLQRSNVQATGIQPFLRWTREDEEATRNGGPASGLLGGNNNNNNHISNNSRDPSYDSLYWLASANYVELSSRPDPSGSIVDYFQALPSLSLPPLASSSSGSSSQPLPPLRSIHSLDRPVASTAQASTPTQAWQALPPPSPSPPPPPPPLFSSQPPNPLLAAEGGTSSSTTNNGNNNSINTGSSTSPAWPRQSSTLSSVISSLDEINHDLEDANSHMRALLDQPTPNDLLSNVPPRPLPLPQTMASSSDPAAGSRREPSRSGESSRVSKRRRLDSDKATVPAFTGFRYGRYGQVEPGLLTMEIASCDGGLYSDETSYAAENILKSDNSVYCTKGNRCNIVLQHQGCTTFSLKELIIKAPGRNYSSPVREGLVFLYMNKDELPQTDQDQHNSGGQPFRGEMDNAFNSSGRLTSHNEQASTSASSVANDIYNYIVENPHMANRPEMPIAARIRMLIECSEDDGTDGPLARIRRGMQEDGANTNGRWSPVPLNVHPRRRRPVRVESSPFGTHVVTWGADGENNDNGYDDDNNSEPFVLAESYLASLDPSRPPRYGESMDHSRDSYGEPFSPLSPPSGVRFESDNNAGNSARHNYTSDATDSRENTDDITTPYANFHIAKENNKCIIHFDPPVTARYILLKMWNPRPDMAGNIDIQGVVAKGFAGPRYFPSCELR